MLGLRKNLVAILFGIAIMLTAGVAMADTSVSWLTPTNGSTYGVGTVLGTGQPDGAITGMAGANIIGTGLDLALVIDQSGSMGGNPLAQAKLAAIALVNNLPEDTTSVAVIGFNRSSHTYTLLTPLNPNKAVVIAAINSISAGGGTNLGSGVAAGASALVAGHTTGRAMMQVVLSDGYGAYLGQAATAYANHNIVTHTVGVPGHSASLMQQIANEGHGVYTNATSLDDLVDLFDGTGDNNLVGLDRVDIQLANGTWINDIATDTLGNFVLPNQVIALGANTFTAYAYGNDGTSGSATLTLNGTGNGPAPVPEPATILLLGVGLAGLGVLNRRKNKK